MSDNKLTGSLTVQLQPVRLPEGQSVKMGAENAGVLVILGEGGRNLLTIYADGTVIGDVEHAGEAAAMFVRELHRIAVPPTPEVGGDNTEYGVRDHKTGRVTNWGEDHPKFYIPTSYPGYTQVSRTVGDWQPLAPKEDS